jgi:hypothetical protein
MSREGDDRRGGMTLAFSLAAIERLADPAAAFEDAGRWSGFVGVVDDDREAVERTVAERGLRQDFDPGDRDRWLALQAIREATHAPRYVYVGATGEDRRVAVQLGWEYVPVTEAAGKADWALADEGPDGGLLARFLRAVRERLSSSGPS